MHALKFLTVGILAVLATVTLAVDPPDSVVRPETGNIETVDAVWNGSDYEIRHVTDPGKGQPLKTFVLTSTADDDLDPRIAIASGLTWTAWWREGAPDQVLIRKSNDMSITWGAARLVSESNEGSRHPQLAHDGTDVWVVYESDDATGTSISVRMIVDEPDPIGIRHIVETTDYAGDIDVGIESESGNLWVTWVDSGVDVGWSVYDSVSDSWGIPDFESYSQDDVESARERIRDLIVGG